MSLPRELLIIFLSLLSFITLTRASFLSIQRLLSQPSDHPALIETQTTNFPTTIKIPAQALALPIYPSLIINGEWEVLEQGISLLNPTNSNTTGLIMYGHNWNSLLGRLHQAKLGESIDLAYSDGKQESYVIQSIFTVPADRLDVLQLAGPEKLLIYTCSGFLDRQRLVVLAERLPTTVSAVTK